MSDHRPADDAAPPAGIETGPADESRSADGPTDGPADGPSHAAQAWGLAKDLGPVVTALLVATLSLPAINGFLLLGYAATQQDALVGVIGDVGVLPVAAITALLFALATGSALLPTYAFSFACGVFFGFADGGVVAMLGITGGALVGYAWGAALARRRVMDVIDKHPKASVIRAAIIDRSLRDELLAVFLLRFPPNSPFALTNLVMSSTGVRLLPYTVGTATGIAARTLFAVWIGAQVGMLDDVRSKERWHVILAIGVSVVVFVMLFKLFTRWSQAALKEHLGVDAEAADDNDSGPTPRDNLG